VIYDLHDKLKSVTRGYGTMDYELIGYFPADLVRLDILVGGKKVDALSIICDRATPTAAGGRSSRSSAARSTATCSRSPCRPRSARR
jgi:translation elongation factor EF-4